MKRQIFQIQSVNELRGQNLKAVFLLLLFDGFFQSAFNCEFIESDFYLQFPNGNDTQKHIVVRI